MVSRAQLPAPPPVKTSAAIVVAVEPVTVSEPDAAKLLSIGVRTLFDLRARGEIGFLRIGGRILYRVAELRRFAAEREEKPEQAATMP